MRAPEIEKSTMEERENYIKETFKCISDCDCCGICRIYRNKDPLLVYQEYIKGNIDFQTIANQYK